MSVRIGLAVATDTIRAVAVRGGDVVWKAEVPGDDARPLGAALAELLSAVPVPRWPRPAIVAAVGPARAQLRRLSGFPPVTDDGMLARLVAESAGRFFLRNGIPLVTTGVLREEDGQAWGGAIEAPVVAALEATCRDHGFRLAAVLPAVAVIQYALEGEVLAWRDGDVCAELTLTGSQLCAFRRTVATADTSEGSVAEHPLAVAALAALGAEGWRFADAYGAAVASPSDPLAYRPARAASAPRVPKWRLALASAACAITVAASLIAPSLAARHAAARATERLSTIAMPRRAAAAAEADLALVTGALGEVAAFDEDRRSATLLLAELARALPRGSALVTLRADSTGGVLVALAPRAAILMGTLERVPGLASPTIVGPITREVAERNEVERVTVRFRWADEPAPAVAPRRAP